MNSTKIFYSDFFKRVEEASDFRENLYSQKVTQLSNLSKKDCLFKDCFSNHVDFYDYTITELKLSGTKESRYINQDTLSAYFINKVYSVPKILDFNNYEKEWDYEEYRKEIFSNNFTEDSSDSFSLGSNRIRFVVGEIGTGKSAFIKRLICDLQRNHKDKDDYRVLPVYINLEEVFNYGYEPTPLKDKFQKKLFDRIVASAEGSIADLNMTKINGIAGDWTSSLPVERLVKELKAQNVRLILFIDNLDFYHYFDSRYSFFEEYNKQQYARIDDNIIWLISLFKTYSNYENLGLTVVIAIREHVFKYLQREEIRTSVDTSSAIILQIESFNTVVASRLKLMSEAILLINRHNSKDNPLEHYKHVLNIFRTSLIVSNENFKSNIIQKIQKFSQQGFRSFVHFLSHLELDYSNNILIERFLENPNNSLTLLYINHLNRLYSQSQDHFPNIFLVDCTLLYNEDHALGHKPHLHTYWLKYFILKYICEHKLIKVSKLINVFVKKGGYKEHLVRHVIGSLCTANEFRCAEVKNVYNKSSYVDARCILATERGREMFANEYGVEFCLSITYLETILDDRWLSLPKPFFNNIYDNTSDYQYLYEHGENYSKIASSVVSKKTRRIIYFLNILKYAYEIEIKYKRKDLHKDLSDHYLVPNIDLIINNTINAAVKISESLHKPLNEEEIQDFRRISLDFKKSGEIKSFFNDYYNSNVEVAN